MLHIVDSNSVNKGDNLTVIYSPIIYPMRYSYLQVIKSTSNILRITYTIPSVQFHKHQLDHCLLCILYFHQFHLGFPKSTNSNRKSIKINSIHMSSPYNKNSQYKLFWKRQNTRSFGDFNIHVQMISFI